MDTLKSLILVAVPAIVAGCSSINSVESPSPSQTDGLFYYMPKKDIVVKLTVEKQVVTKADFDVTAAYPDLSTPYVLSYARNLLGKNTLDVTISEQGLLTTANSTTVSGISDAFKGLAATAGALAGLSANAVKPASEACSDGEYVFRIEAAPFADDRCGVKITVAGLTPKPEKISSGKQKSTGYSGVFYRQGIPYLVSAERKGDSSSFGASSILFSPSESATHFLPASSTLFSGNDAQFSFKDGVPVAYKQDADGEIVALLKLPADVIASYFTAVGSVFDSFKSNDDKKAAAIDSNLALQLSLKKYDACVQAIKDKDDATIKQLGC